MTVTEVNQILSELDFEEGPGLEATRSKALELATCGFNENELKTALIWFYEGYNAKR